MPDIENLEYDVSKVSQEMKVRPEILQRLVASFAKTLEDKMVLLEEALKTKDIAKMRALLHEIRGTSGNLRLEAVASAGKVMHEAVKSENDQGKVPEYFEILESKAQALTNYIARQESKDVENPNS